MLETKNQPPGQRVRAARLAAGLSIPQLAEQLGIGRVYLGDMERGKRALTLERLDQIARSLGCDPHGLDERLARRDGAC